VNIGMAPIAATAIIFKDFVNEGRVPEENFVEKSQEVCSVPLAACSEHELTLAYRCMRRLTACKPAQYTLYYVFRSTLMHSRTGRCL
jgi:hypothetical protein